MSAPAPASFAVFSEEARQQPLYIVLGSQGAGTNLVTRLLSRAFNFLVVQDGSVICSAAARLGSAPRRADIEREYKLIRSRLFPSAFVRKTSRLIKSRASFDNIDDHFDPERIHSGADLARFIFTYGAYTLGTRLMVLKSDDLWQHLDQVAEVVPNRRIVLLTRDFRDNLLSITNKNFGPVEPLVAAEYVRERFVRYEEEYLRTAPEHRFHVRYEEMLAAPFEFVRRFGDYFGIEPVADGEARVEALRIRPGKVNKWRALDPQQLAHIEALLGGELHRYGYELAVEAPAEADAATWMMAKTRDALKRVPQKIRRLATRLGR